MYVRSGKSNWSLRTSNSSKKVVKWLLANSRFTKLGIWSKVRGNFFRNEFYTLKVFRFFNAIMSSGKLVIWFWLKSIVVIWSKRQSLLEISVRPLALKSSTLLTRNSLISISHGSYYEDDPGMFLITACLFSSTWTSPSSKRIFR